MAEETKAWDRLAEAISDMWIGFASSTLSLPVYCTTLTDDDRFPAEFLKKFLEEAQHEESFDTEELNLLKLKSLMDACFKKAKKQMKKKGQKLRKKQNTKEAAENLGAEDEQHQEETNHVDEEPEETSPQEIADNLAKMKLKKEQSEARKDKIRKNRASDIAAIHRSNAMKAKETIMENQLRGLRDFKEEYEKFGH